MIRSEHDDPRIIENVRGLLRHIYIISRGSKYNYCAVLLNEYIWYLKLIVRLDLCDDPCRNILPVKALGANFIHRADVPDNPTKLNTARERVLSIEARKLWEIKVCDCDLPNPTMQVVIKMTEVTFAVPASPRHTGEHIKKQPLDATELRLVMK